MQSIVDSSQGVIFLTLTAFTDDAEALEVIEHLEPLFSQNPQKLAIIVYLDGYKNSTSRARFLAAEFLRTHKEQLFKVALVGSSNPAFELAVKIVITLSSFKTMKFFAAEKEALIWVQSTNS